ncbi:MAG: Crp/Fnr family transcriptional regulator [Bacteroidia bacterium]
MSVKKDYPPDCRSCFIRGLSIFSNLRDEDIAMLNENKGHMSYKKGKIIFNEGQRPTGVYVVYSGKVKIFKLGPNAKEQIIRLAKEGDVLGYRSLIGGENYKAAAETLEDSLLCFLSKENFFKILSANESVSMNLLKLLSDNLGAAETKVVEIVQKPTRHRVAEALLLLKEMYGMEPDGQTLNISMVRDDIANLAGMATETAIRILYELRQDGVIELEKKKIRIMNLQKLVRESQVMD